MLYEKSAGFVIFRKEKNLRYYLLLYKAASGIYSESWSFPKGLIEKGESELETAKREVAEETGLKKLKLEEGFKQKIHYFYKKDNDFVSKDVIYFLAKTQTKKVKISWEHAGYAWLPYKEALARLTFKTDKQVLVAAEKFLTLKSQKN
ncbi:MAG: bis(5'-nucleosyl)-tetraphosphatase [Candidatus Nanoarchaeia archaeon]